MPVMVIECCLTKLEYTLLSCTEFDRGLSLLMIMAEIYANWIKESYNFEDTVK